MTPRLKKLLLLQQQAGGELPKGYTELEYLESSGTQRIDTGLILEYPCRAVLKTACLAKDIYNIYVFGATNNSALSRRFYFTVYNENGNFDNVAFFCVGELSDLFNRVGFNTAVLHEYSLDNESFSVDGELVADTKSAVFTQCSSSTLLFSRNGGVNYFVGIIASAKFYHNGKIIGDFVPALDPSGTPCMYDKVTRTPFYNSGTGTFGYALKGQGESSTYSLRNPGVVPPSGVFARPAGENALDIIADTDMEADTAEQQGYAHFANTGEACEHFGIVPEEAEHVGAS